MSKLGTRVRRSLARLAFGAAVASFAMVGLAKADTDGITNSGKVAVTPSFFNCAAVPAPAGSSWTPSAFSFDISWVDKDVRGFFLADRSHNTTTANGGDVGFIDLQSSPLTFTHWDPPAADPFAGIACDQNTAFGGTTGVGRNEITGPNGAFTVNHAEVWLGDGPSKFQPAQGHGTATTVAGATTYSGVPSDYAADPCDSSVRVFDIATHQQTDHINVGGCFRTDEGAFDPDDQIALFANPSEQPIPASAKGLNASPFLTFLSTRPVPVGQHHAILKQINYDGTNGTVKADQGIEQAVYSHETGLFYVAIPGTSAFPAGYVSVIDPDKDGKHGIHVVGNFALTNNCAPTGAALGPDYELLLGCSNAGAAEQVIDIRNGHLIKMLTGTSGGCDEVAFNAGDDHFVGACTDSNATGSDNLDISDADPAKFDQAINTNTKGAHSVAADPVTVTDFQPAASGTGANAGPPAGLCGATPCILLFSSSGGDDASAHAQEAAEDKGDGDGKGNDNDKGHH
jgi:hypothetical protein